MDLPMTEHKAILACALAVALGCRAPGAAPAPDPPGSATPFRAARLEEVRLEDHFWRPRLERNRTVTIPHILEQNRQTGRVANFERAAGKASGEYEGRRFNDTDVYKVVEAAAYTTEDPSLAAEIEGLVERIAAAQEVDGYLMPARTVDPASPAPGLGPERWLHVSAGSHELYNAGHLMEAAVAHWRATGDRRLLAVAIRLADRIDADFGPDARRDVPGHEEVELALVKLADATGERRYLELARFFLDGRGGEHDGEPYPEDSPFAIYNDRRYRQDHQPVTAQHEAVGHAVLATYLYAGMADVAARTEAPGYAEALERVWRDLVSTKLYLTGGIGSRDTFESFGEPYELPDETAYAETCAAIGNDLWNHRMFLATGEPAYLDVVERILYNGFLSGVSLTGDRFFYTNPLASAGGVERAPYFEVACCPANLARMMALLPTFLYAVGGRPSGGGEEIVVGLYAGSEAVLETSGGPVRIVQRTAYPWRGEVRLEVAPERERELVLALRLPGWARERPVPSDLYRFADPAAPPPTLRLGATRVTLTPGRHPLPGGGEVVVEGGFARVRRVWPAEGGASEAVELVLPMPARRVAAHPAVAAAAGRLALQRGPVVYALEGVDHGGTLAGLRLPAGEALAPHWRPDLLGGVVTLSAPVQRMREAAAGGAAPSPERLLAVPYFAWANRGPGEMAVWLDASEPAAQRLH